MEEAEAALSAEQGLQKQETTSAPDQEELSGTGEEHQRSSRGYSPRPDPHFYGINGDQVKEKGQLARGLRKEDVPLEISVKSVECD